MRGEAAKATVVFQNNRGKRRSAIHPRRRQHQPQGQTLLFGFKITRVSPFPSPTQRFARAVYTRTIRAPANVFQPRSAAIRHSAGLQGNDTTHPCHAVERRRVERGVCDARPSIASPTTDVNNPRVEQKKKHHPPSFPSDTLHPFPFRLPRYRNSIRFVLALFSIPPVFTFVTLALACFAPLAQTVWPPSGPDCSIDRRLQKHRGPCLKTRPKTTTERNGLVCLTADESSVSCFGRRRLGAAGTFEHSSTPRPKTAFGELKK